MIKLLWTWKQWVDICNLGPMTFTPSVTWGQVADYGSSDPLVVNDMRVQWIKWEFFSTGKFSQLNSIPSGTTFCAKLADVAPNAHSQQKGGLGVLPQKYLENLRGKVAILWLSGGLRDWRDKLMNFGTAFYFFQEKWRNLATLHWNPIKKTTKKCVFFNKNVPVNHNNKYYFIIKISCKYTWWWLTF